ncbi:recombinase [Desulfoluna spongiiphila]|uniref:Phage integrase, N-terminal SAM-like domain n=1 Tax=Desulfoluna spongiiphila TaxID=419481 RepID=A0A1G5I557_9BACT|nr:recombinase [Desulfoluna spongiiphila]SCY70921.1 hypothetical protein SAMN05216233_117108 [Desulfoluna spongiiphila]VVS92727.1 integrase/recombinase n-terminal [Desulfoluna spongiiphila]
MQDDVYDKASEEIRTANALVLDEFGRWLEESKLSENTISNHVSNIDFYINEFLLYEELTTPEEGMFKVGGFLGFWFIKKAMWASAASLKSCAASLKKFYTFMADKGRVDKEDLRLMKREIKADMPEWLATLARYDDPDTDLDDVWVY